MNLINTEVFASQAKDTQDPIVKYIIYIYKIFKHYNFKQKTS